LIVPKSAPPGFGLQPGLA